MAQSNGQFHIQSSSLTSKIYACHQETAGPGGNRDSIVKVKFWSHLKEDVYEMWADMVLSIDSSKAAESLQTKGKDGDSVDGIRHRFQVCLELVHWAMKTS